MKTGKSYYCPILNKEMKILECMKAEHPKVLFAPTNLPIQTSVQTIAAVSWIYTMSFGGLLGILLTIYLILFSKLWPIILIYLIWIALDRETCETGGRRNKWIQSWDWWEQFRNYFPIRLQRIPWIEFDSTKNHLFCYFPHDVLTVGAFSIFSTERGEFGIYFPGFKPYLCVFNQHFHIPFFREIFLAMGACAPSEKSLHYLLGEPKGGNAVGLMIGGVAEPYNCKTRQYTLNLKNKKDFIEIALKNGSPLVPVFSFGETNLFSQVDDSHFFQICQKTICEVTGGRTLIPIVRRFLNVFFGLFPSRQPVYVIVGAPLLVKKIEYPSQIQIDDLHREFVEELVHLFETQKRGYLPNADDVHIEIC